MSDYKIHPIALIFPRPTEEEYASIKASVKAIGFRSPVIVWGAPDGHEYIIDGATRIGIRDELRRDGITTADNGAALEPEYRKFVGTEREALEHAGALILRRDLTKSQKAGVAIKTGAMVRQLDAKDRGEDPLTLTAEPAGELAERVATRAGVNKTYIYDMATVHESYPDLTDRVVNGICTVPEAKDIAKRRAAGLPDYPTKDEGAPTDVPVTPKAAAVLDGLGNPVHESMAEVFAFRKDVARIRLAAAKTLKEAQAVADGPGGAGITFGALKSHVKGFRDHLENHQPHIVCTSCTGTGDKFGGQPGEKCNTCGGRRYLDKLQYSQLPEKLRARLEKREATPEGEANAAPAASPAAEAAPAKPRGKGRGKAKPAETAATEPAADAAPIDPSATASREFAPGELTPNEWDTDTAAALGDLPNVPPAELETADAGEPAADIPAPAADDKDPFDM